MRVKTKLRNLSIRALTESMDVHTMVHIARNIFGSYNLHERTGYPASVPIPNKEAARQIVQDFIDSSQFLTFVQTLLAIDAYGISGRRCRIPRLKDIIYEIMEMGYLFDSDSLTFIEDPSKKISRNWGVFKEGDELLLTFLHVDIVGNSELVRKYNAAQIEETYRFLHNLVMRICEKRNGRIWNWEGDGGLIAFNYADKNTCAVLSGMEILHELFIFNRLYCPLDEEVRVRIVVHNGPCEYQENFSDIKSDTLDSILEIETEYAEPQTMIISDSVYPSLDPHISEVLKLMQITKNKRFFTYELEFAA
jgi:hypothetical protein